MGVVTYLHLASGGALPRLESGHFKAVLVIDDNVTPEWQTAVSDWLVRSGCRYMMAWGQKCGEWDDSVDYASIRLFDFGEAPEDDFVMTTWHDKDSLMDTFWFSTHAAMHPSLNLEQIYIIHIAPSERSDEILQTFRDAQET